MTVIAGMCPGGFFCQRRWQWIFKCRLSWCLQICPGCAFLSCCDQVTPHEECHADLLIRKAPMCPHFAQGTARIRCPRQGFIFCSPLQWYCYEHFKGAKKKKKLVLKLKFLNVEYKKKKTSIWIQFLET